jgi:hypothetical protein
MAQVENWNWKKNQDAAGAMETKEFWRKKGE